MAATIAAIAIEEWQANTDPRQQRRTTEATDAAACGRCQAAVGTRASPFRAREGQGSGKVSRRRIHTI